MMSLASLALLFIVSNANAQCAFMFSSQDSILTFTSKGGATVTRSFYVKNQTGTAATGQIVITGEGAAQFTVKPSSFEMKEANQKIEVAITYTPASNTVRSTANIQLQGMGMTCYSARLEGTLGDNPVDNKLVVDPAQYTFPATAAGQEVCKEFTIVNKGTTTAYIPGWKLQTEWPNDFSVDPTTSDVKELKAGESLKIKVCYKPIETRTNAISGYLVVNYSFIQNATDFAMLKAWFGTKQGGNDTTITKSCLKQSEDGMGDWKGQVALDSTGNRVLRIYNPTSADIILTAGVLDGEDAKAFMLGVTFPITVPANSTIEVPFTFTPFATSAGTAKEKYFAYAVFTLQGNGTNLCTSFKAVVYGYSIYIHDGDKNTDSTKTVGIKIFGDGKTTIGLSNKGIRESYTLLFYNNLQVDATIQSISMKEGTFFTVTETSPATTPFTLKPGESFTVTISYQSSDNLIHKDALVIVADHAFTAIEIGLEGGDFSTPTSVKKELPAGVAIFVSPNPAHSDVKVDFAGTTHANIEVMDMLGNTVANGQTSGDWTWNGKTASGVSAANGAYIIRIVGTSISGEQFLTSKRVILQK